MSVADKTFGLVGQRAIVTGGARGIGRGIAELLAGLGAMVVVADRDKEGSSVTISNIRDAGGTAFFVKLDLLDEASIAAMVTDARDLLGGIDILINNAAMIGMLPIEENKTDFWDRMQGVNVRGTFLCMREVIREMRAAATGGRIVNISSMAALHPSLDGAAAYCASKGAVNAMSRSAALDCGPNNICINVVMPHAIGHPDASKQFEEHGIASFSGPSLDPSRYPLGRAGTVDDISPMVALLVGPGGSYITGQAFSLDGGFPLS